jgi:hypothetical protein
MVNRLHHEIAEQNVSDALRGVAMDRHRAAAAPLRGFVLRGRIQTALRAVRGSTGIQAPSEPRALELGREHSGC